jgi:transmembrane serine protease 3
MTCQNKKLAGKRFKGQYATSGNWFDSEEICVSVCWQYKVQGHPCSSVNYFAQTKTCEIFMDAYGDANQDKDSVLTTDSLSNYLIPQSCPETFGTTPRPTPTNPPQPTPPTYPEAPASGGSSAPGSTNNIRPGSCGQTSVPNKVTRAYLENRALSQRIVGGFEARVNSVPWIVSLRKWDWHFCGGTLVRVNPNREESDIIITAAHCMDGQANFDVVAGAHYTNRAQNGEQKIAAAKVVSHASYGRGQGNDIAIVKLSKPIKFTSTVQPACLPGPNDTPPYGTNGIVAGWGGLAEGQSGPDALNQVVVPTISPDKCRTMYSNADPITELCAGYDQGKKDACQGDSGGPYVLEGKDGWTLHGVVSWGSGCARARAPGVYARVTTYYDWIQQQIRALSSIRA